MMITDMMKLKQLTSKIIGAGIEVHRILGPGLLERVYHECLCYELSKRGMFFEKEPCLQFIYKDSEIDFDLKPDLIVEESVIVELKAVQEMHPVFSAQLLSYLRLTGIQVGLLLNFHTPLLKEGIIRRTIHGDSLPDNWESH